jgi:hypothetical protein
VREVLEAARVHTTTDLLRTLFSGLRAQQIIKPNETQIYKSVGASVLVQPEMEKRRSPLVSIPPFGRGFSRHGVFRSDGGWAAQERALTPPFIVSMSPPGYPSAWLRPRSARFRFARQNHCNSATSCRFSTSGLPVTPPEPRPARPES